MDGDEPQVRDGGFDHGINCGVAIEPSEECLHLGGKLLCVAEARSTASTCRRWNSQK
jgi:hypothetical protein